MKRMQFDKYHGTGNDFILIDDREAVFPENDTEYIRRLCMRRFGIGADGLILIRPGNDVDFTMLYCNADGKAGSMCGNGGRCAAAFAHRLGITGNNSKFRAFDGVHEATIHDNREVSISMNPPKNIRRLDDNTLTLDTGSPHYVHFVPNDPGKGFVSSARAIRNLPQYKEEGINVNFIWKGEEGYHIRTFERGVEDETYSCGTGVTAGAIAVSLQEGRKAEQTIRLVSRGGEILVRLMHHDGEQFDEVLLTGPAVRVYTGTLPLRDALLP